MTPFARIFLAVEAAQTLFGAIYALTGWMLFLGGVVGCMGIIGCVLVTELWRRA